MRSPLQMMSWPSEQDRRIGLLAMGVCWVLVGAGNLAATPGVKPGVSVFLGILFLGCGLSTFAFLERPSSYTRYTLTGALTILTIAIQLLYSVFNLFLPPFSLKPGLPWVLLVLFLPLFAGFWWFWSSQVRAWHNYHQARVRLTMEDLMSGRRSAWPGSDPQIALKNIRVIRADAARAGMGAQRNGQEAG